MLTDLNAYLGSHISAFWWDAAQFVLGVTCILLILLERRYGARYQTSLAKDSCAVKWMSIRAGQIGGIGILGGLAVLVTVDALTPPPSPPRTMVVMFLLAIVLKQLGSVHSAYERYCNERPDDTGRLSLLGKWPQI